METRDQAYELSLKLASEKLAGIDVEDICARTGAKREGADKIVVDYLNRRYMISLSGGEVRFKNDVTLKEKVLILHYLTFAKGTPLSGNMLSYKQLPGIASYYSVFYRFGLKPVLDRFGKNPELLIDAAKSLGGHEVDYGDVAVTVYAFPRVPVTYVLWRGDEEFPPQGNLMFDFTVSDYLPLEDLREICQAVACELVRISASPS